MRASEILGRHVVTSDGRDIGTVFDIEADIRTDGAVSEIRVVRLLAGPAASILRLGFRRRDMGGPIGVRFLAHRLRGFAVEWRQVEEVGDVISLGVDLDELETLG
ncbi:MAG TPA: hypothetical protein VFK89_11095 [Actinomycetota bacterium]|nr:hypothetical protein [Actinomycetota bacterium]